VALAAAVLAAPAAALPTGNLLANPAAEAAPGVEGGLRGTPTGWVQHAALEAGTQAAYDSCYGGGEEERDVLEKTVGESIGGGARFFFAGEAPISDLWQEVAVDPAEVDGARLAIGGEFGGYEGQEDFAALSATFYDGSDQEIGLIETEPVTAADRGGLTGFVYREVAAPVPAGTTRIRFVLVQLREDGSDNDGYADNLFATFDAAPPAPPAATGDAACPVAAPQPPPSSGGAVPPAQSAPSPSAPTAPGVTITKGPPRESAQASAPFSFTGTPGGGFECALDGGAWASCASGKDFGPVAPGDHLFQVRETLGGQTSAPASYRWTVDLPRQCVLRVARARVFVFAKRDAARLVIHYTSYRPAQVSVGFQLRGRKGGAALGSAASHFAKAGVFRLPVKLDPATLAKLRAAKSFQVAFRIPGTPGTCARFYKKRLTIPRRISGQTVWFQSDSSFAPGAGAPSVGAARRVLAAPRADRPTVAQAVDHFVEDEVQPVERRMQSFAKFLEALPRARKACETAAAGKAGVVAAVRLEAENQIKDVRMIEHDELILYSLAKALRGKNRANYVDRLDSVGAALDNQLNEAKSVRRLAHEIQGDCAKVDAGSGEAKNWTTFTGMVNEALAHLHLAYGID